MIAYFIKTFSRNDCLFEAVEAIERYPYVSGRIYIADDGHIDSDREALYQRLERQDHRILRLPFDMGASAGRNAALRYITEPYVLRMDDDFIITEDTRLDRMIKLLDSVPTLGAVSGLERQRHKGKGIEPGAISPGQGELRQYYGSLWKIPFDLEHVRWDVADGVRYKTCGYTRNLLLIRREVLDQLRWDPRLKIRGEHIDFQLRLRRFGWQLACTPDSIHEHAGPAGEEQLGDYQRYRYRDGGYMAVLHQNWGVLRILVDRKGGSSESHRRRASAREYLRVRPKELIWELWCALRDALATGGG